MNELLDRFRRDQETCRSGTLSEYSAITKDNSIWLKSYVATHGWPREYQHEAWLIAQHSSDVAFQEQCLSLITQLPSSPQRNEEIAFLTDRIRMRKGLPQIYGTQFVNNKPWPIEHVDELDARRTQMGLGSFSEYCMLLSQRF